LRHSFRIDSSGAGVFAVAKISVACPLATRCFEVVSASGITKLYHDPKMMVLAADFDRDPGQVV